MRAMSVVPWSLMALSLCGRSILVGFDQTYSSGAVDAADDAPGGADATGTPHEGPPSTTTPGERTQATVTGKRRTLVVRRRQETQRTRGTPRRAAPPDSTNARGAARATQACSPAARPALLAPPRRTPPPPATERPAPSAATQATRTATETPPTDARQASTPRRPTAGRAGTPAAAPRPCAPQAAARATAAAV